MKNIQLTALVILSCLNLVLVCLDEVRSLIFLNSCEYTFREMYSCQIWEKYKILGPQHRQYVDFDEMKSYFPISITYIRLAAYWIMPSGHCIQKNLTILLRLPIASALELSTLPVYSDIYPNIGCRHNCFFIFKFCMPLERLVRYVVWGAKFRLLISVGW